MNEELQQTLNTALAGVIEGVTNAKDFIVAETPEVIQQLLTWHLVESLLTQLFGVLLLVLTVWLVKRITKLWESDPADEVIAWGTVVGVIAGCSSLACGSVFVTDIAWLKIWIAPKVYLIEYAAKLVAS